MRYSPEHKDATRERVLREAARLIREHGPLGVGVADIMSRAGLTHGGFYAHFASKDALVAAAIARMFVGAQRRFDGVDLATYIDRYLSPAHRDERATGCPIPALASDLPRLSRGCRAAYATGTRALTDRLASELRARGHRGAAADTLAASVVAELVGALALARAEPDAARSDAVLAASRRSLRARLGLPRGGRS
jgi:TetR/AcrR family transcriptional repressor of nem operon|nr:TetR/AcrR family transcriptional regulator [Kofleriaceae bacterium]